jgi:hypothetical protein
LMLWISNIGCLISIRVPSNRVKVFAPGSNEEKKFANALIAFHCAKQIGERHLSPTPS